MNKEIYFGDTPYIILIALTEMPKGHGGCDMIFNYCSFGFDCK